MITLNVNGTEYNCQLTMGAMIRFREITGYEVHQCTESSRDMCAFLWACIASTAKREGKTFDIPFMDFCDQLDLQTVIDGWSAMREDLGGEPDGEADSEKKSR